MAVCVTPIVTLQQVSLKQLHRMSLLCESCVYVISNVLGGSYRQSLFRKSVIVGKMSCQVSTRCFKWSLSLSIYSCNCVTCN